MGEILPFFAKVRARGDWSAAERDRLAELADRFGGDAAGIDVVFGATDEGEPWCVVKDADDEVLVHVARIGGRFIVHYAFDDGLTEAADLPAALGQRLNYDAEDEVVVPFSRRAQSILALLVATAFFYEMREHGGEHAPAAHDGHAPTDPMRLADGAAEGHAAHAEHGLPLFGHWSHGERPSFAHEDPDSWAGGGPANRAAVDNEAHAAAAPPAHVQPALQLAAFVAPPGKAPEHLLAAASDQHAAQADKVAVSTGAVAAGHAGADEFVVRAPDHMGDGNVYLGSIAGYQPSDGDRLITADGHSVNVVATFEPMTMMSLMAHPSRPLTTEAQTETRLVVDLNGDGQADGYLLLTSGPASAEPSFHVASLTDNGALMLAGQNLDHYV